MSKTIYHYNKETGVYAGSSLAKRSPLDKDEVYLIPAYSTDKEPPVVAEGNVAVFKGKDWVEVSLQVIPDPQAESIKEKKNLKAELKDVADIEGMKKFLLKVMFGDKDGKT